MVPEFCSELMSVMSKAPQAAGKGEGNCAHGKDALRLASPMHPAASFRRELKLKHIDHI
jgi:hypothetical protein